jgi:hypothetical protein
MPAMRQFLWYLIFGASLFIGYQGYQNAQNFHETQGVAREAVCKTLNQASDACDLPANAEPNGHSTGVTGRTYQFTTKAGAAYLAECKREYTFFGQWSCTARSGSLM